MCIRDSSQGGEGLLRVGEEGIGGDTGLQALRGPRNGLQRPPGGIGLPGIGEQLSGALRASSGEEGGDGLPQRIQPCAGGGADHTQMGNCLLYTSRCV